MSYNPDQRIIRKDAAVLARTSEDTLRRAEKRSADPVTRKTDPDT